MDDWPKHGGMAPLISHAIYPLLMIFVAFTTYESLLCDIMNYVRLWIT